MRCLHFSVLKKKTLSKDKCHSGLHTLRKVEPSEKEICFRYVQTILQTMFAAIFLP